MSLKEQSVAHEVVLSASLELGFAALNYETLVNSPCVTQMRSYFNQPTCYLKKN